MNNLNFPNQMTEFDFNLPIDVKIIFDDSDEEETSNTIATENRTIKNDKNIKAGYEKECETECVINNSREDKNLHKNLNKSTLSLKKHIKSQNRDKISKKINMKNNEMNGCQSYGIEANVKDAKYKHNEDNSDSNQNSLSPPQERIENNNEKRLTNEITERDPVIYIEDLLNKLSEHLILILQCFYYSRKQVNNFTILQDDAKRKFINIKSHYFELSFTIMETIVIPQEQNDSFINTFLDNTILMANNKCLIWKVSRHDVQTLFIELLAWTKQKRDYINKYQQMRNSPNENIILKRSLMRPLQPLNIPLSKNTVNCASAPTSKPQSNLCIFSSGSPGREISINIDADTLINCTAGNLNTSNSESALNHNSVAPLPYGNNVHYIQNINNIFYHPSSKNIGQMSDYHLNTRNPCNKAVNANQTYYNARQPYRHHNRGPIQNYDAQRQYTNINQASPTGCENLNPLYNETPLENQVSCHPPITPNVTSLNPKSFTTVIVRCCMCGKKTSSRYAPYPPYGPSCCSYLCQELNSQITGHT